MKNWFSLVTLALVCKIVWSSMSIWLTYVPELDINSVCQKFPSTRSKQFNELVHVICVCIVKLKLHRDIASFPGWEREVE